MAVSGQDREQRMIDQQVLLSHARRVREQCRAASDARRESKAALGERLWLREQYAAMLRSAVTEQEARGLGLSDEVIREARLGDTVADAWTRLRTPRVARDADRAGRPPP